MDRLCFLPWFVVMLCFGTYASQAQTGPAQAPEFRRVLQQTISDPGFADAFIQQLYIPADFAPVFREHFLSLGREEAFVHFLADEIVLNQAYFTRQDGSVDASKVHELTAALSQNLALSGFARLAVDDQRSFVSFMVETLRQMSPEDCAASMTTDMDVVDSQLFELFAMLRLPPDRVRRHLAVTRRAVLAEITGRPILVPLLPTEVNIARSAYFAAIDAAMNAHPHRAELMIALENIDYGSPFIQCEVAKISIQTALDIQGTVGNWVIRWFSHGIRP